MPLAPRLFRRWRFWGIKTMRASSLGFAVAIAALGASLDATAQAGSARQNRHYPYEYAPPVHRADSGVICQKMCPQDLSPCDPVNFKMADARCAGVLTR
jgi:hypothetical protein